MELLRLFLFEIIGVRGKGIFMFRVIEGVGGIWRFLVFLILVLGRFYEILAGKNFLFS